jgi:hypothetical protein
MMMSRILATTALFALAACSSSPSGPAAGGRRPAAKHDPATMVAHVRSVGATGTELEVQPLRDPQVQDLRDEAEALEKRGKTRDAEARIDQALTISVEDPDLLQWKAELALYRRAWAEAEQLANRSFERGPKLGGLCRRNWATVQQVRSAAGDAAGVAAATTKLDACTVAPPVRM